MKAREPRGSRALFFELDCRFAARLKNGLARLRWEYQISSGLGGHMQDAEPSWMNCGHQREGENRLGYAERSEPQPAVYQPREDISTYERY